MNPDTLLQGYQRVIAEIYRPTTYFSRCFALLKNLTRHQGFRRKIGASELRALVMSLFKQTFSFYGLEYVKFMAKVVATRPTRFSEAVTLAVKGHHFLKITRETLRLEKFKRILDELSASIHEKVKGKIEEISAFDVQVAIRELTAYRDRLLADLHREYENLHTDFQPFAEEALQNFERMMDQIFQDLSGPIMQRAAVPVPAVKKKSR